MEPKLKNRIGLLCERVRGAIDSGDFKQYIFTFMFGKCTSEEFRSQINEYEAQFGEFDYKDLDDEDSLEIKEESLRDYGLFYKPSELFCNILNTENNIHLKIEQVFKQLNETLQGTSLANIFSEVNFLSTRLGQNDEEKHTRIKHIMEAIEEIYSFKLDNVFADLFEFLMHMYATNGGSAGGEFFTPPQVAELLSSLLPSDENQEVYDPTCGTGSLLRKVKARKYYGEDINPLSVAVCRMMMFIEGLSTNSFDIRCTNTLSAPTLSDKKFDVIISNPPYSVEYEEKKLKNDPRVQGIGVAPPRSKGDWMFMAHCLHSIKNDGVIGAVMFPGTFYREHRETKIRQHLVENKLIEAIILLPSQMFFKTSTATCLLLMRKNRTNSDILLIDANNFSEHIGAFNFITESGMKQIQDIYKHRREIPNVSKLLDLDLIRQENYNLCVRNYIKKPRQLSGRTIEEIDLELKQLDDEINNLVQ